MSAKVDRLHRLTHEKAMAQWGYRALMLLGPELEEAVMAQQALAILMSQELVSYAPAQELIRRCLGKTEEDQGAPQ